MRDPHPQPADSILARLNYEALFGVDCLPRGACREADTVREEDNLEAIAAEISTCRLCHLGGLRTHPVPGEGDSTASIVFVGEGPGRDEDAEGRPFVGRAGKLLDRMMAAIGLSRANAYVANVVKCRPPENRSPTPIEMATCMPYLRRQLRVISPKIVCCLGGTASSAILQEEVKITMLRGTPHEFPDFTVVPTYHPAYLLRNPKAKVEAWHDLQLIQRLLEGTRT